MYPVLVQSSLSKKLSEVVYEVSLKTSGILTKNKPSTFQLHPSSFLKTFGKNTILPKWTLEYAVR